MGVCRISHGTEAREKNTAALECASLGSVISWDVLPLELCMNAREFDDSVCRQVFEVCLRMEEKRTGIDYADVCMTDEMLDLQTVYGLWEKRCIGSVLIVRNVSMLREAPLTSVGKRVLLAFMMRNAAKAGRCVLLVSCEMSGVQNAES